MSQRLQDFINQVNLSQNDWRVAVGNPYISAYATAFSSYKDTLERQRDVDKQAGELFVTAACIATGSVLLATVGSATMRMLARRTVVRIANRTLSNNFQKLFRTVRKNEGVTFAAGKLIDELNGGLKKKAEEIAAAHVQSVSQIISPEPLVHFLHMDSVMRANVNCAIRLAQAIERDTSASSDEKARAYRTLMAAPIANSPSTRSSRTAASLAELIELTFYLSAMLETDSLVSWPASYAGGGTAGAMATVRRATSVPITQRPGETSYPRPDVPRTSALGHTPAHQSIAITRAGSEVQAQTNKLSMKVFNKPVYGSSLFGLLGPADTQKSVELRQADMYLDRLATMLKPQNPLDAIR